MKKSIAVLGVALLSCLATNATAASSPGEQYLKDAAPVNAALAAFDHDAAGWTSKTTNTEMEKTAKPFLKAIDKFQNELLTQKWPHSAQHDIRALYVALTPLEADLLSLSTVNAFDVSEFLASYTNDIETIGADTNIVRHDLKLSLNTN